MTYHPREYLEARNWREALAMGLPWKGKPYGFLLCVDDDGKMVTAVTEDIIFHRMLVALPHSARAGLTLPSGIYDRSRSGWPGEPGWTSGVPYTPSD